MSGVKDSHENAQISQLREWIWEDFMWIGESWEELAEKYGGLFVAIYRKRVIDYDERREDLVERLRAKFEDPEMDTLIIYVPPREVRMLKRS